MASLRLKFLRQAAQTAAYLKLLGDLQSRTPADAIAGAMAKYALSEASSGVPGLGGPIGWQQEPVFYVDARLMLRQELMLATGRAENSEVAQSRRFRWLHFHERTAWVRLGSCPGQLTDQLDAFGTPTGVMRSVLRLIPYCDRAVCNPTLPGEPVGQLSWPMLNFGTLPATWKPNRYNVPVESQPPGAPLPVALAADGAELPIDPTGRVAMPLVLKGDAGQELATPAVSTPVLPAHPFHQPPHIDGKLDEWPSGNWFQGSGFARLGMADPSGLFAQPTPPPVKTWFMAGYDDQHLYLAVACLGQKPAEVTTRYANQIELDCGQIVGEDAVEIVLDPTGGQLDRQGLFHLAVKPTGTVLGWRGMTGAGGTGKPELWGRNIRAEVSFQPTYWLIELAIPRNELGPANAHGLWRINVIRHLAAQGEHSAWASSNPMTGEPESLGNLLLRRPPLPKREIQLEPPSPLDD